MTQHQEIVYGYKDEGSCRQHFSLWMDSGICEPWIKVLHLGQKLELKRDKTILGEGEYIDGIYFLLDGVLRLISYDEEGNEAILLYITEKNLFGDSAYFNKMPVYAIFSAVEDSIIYYFNRNKLDHYIFTRYPELTSNLLEYMAYKVGVLLHHQCEVVSDDVLGKVCRMIFDIAKYTNFEPIIHSKITQKEMATALGLHRATFSKVISELKNRDVLEWITKKEIIIKDSIKLHKYAQNVFAL